MYIFFILNILSYLKGPKNITDIMDHVQGNGPQHNKAIHNTPALITNK